MRKSPGRRPASAALPGAIVRDAISPFDSEPTKTARALCPAGTRVTGTGAEVFDVSFDGPQLYLEAVVPEVLVGGVPGNDVQVIARESIATDVAWNIRRHSHCSR